MWIKMNEKKPPLGVLVLVEQELTGRCLRYRAPADDWYDEAGNYDDSKLEIKHWVPIEPPSV
jgi:hypothetical protein